MSKARVTEKVIVGNAGNDFDLLVNADGSINVSTSSGGTGAVNITEILGAPVSTDNPLPVESLDAAAPSDGSGNITTPTGTITSTNIDGFSTVTFSIQGTYAGLNAVFEQSDNGGVSWYPVDAYRIGTGLVETGIVNQTNASVNWRATISGSDSFRIRATSLTSGTVAVLMSFSAMPSGAAVGMTANFVDNRPTAGTITIVDSGSTTTSGQNSASLITGTPTVGSVFALSLNGYSGFYALVTGTWTGTLQFEKSIDGGTTWTPFSVHVDSTAFTQVAITGNCSVRSAGAGATDVRLRATAAVTGTANVRFVFASADTVTTITNSVRLFDNTSGATMTIKAASTPASLTDTAIVTTTAGAGATGSATFTCGTTAYAANDVVGASGANAAISFPNLGPAAAHIMITGASIEIDTTALISGEGSYYLALYSVTPPSALNDSVAWDVPAGDRASFLGLFTIGTPVDLGSTLYVEINGINKLLAMTGTGIFGYLVSAGAYTPTARVFVVKIQTSVI